MVSSYFYTQGDVFMSKTVVEKGTINSVEALEDILRKYKEYDKEPITRHYYRISLRLIKVGLDFSNRDLTRHKPIVLLDRGISIVQLQPKMPIDAKAYEKYSGFLSADSSIGEAHYSKFVNIDELKIEYEVYYGY